MRFLGRTRWNEALNEDTVFVDYMWSMQARLSLPAGVSTMTYLVRYYSRKTTWRFENSGLAHT